MTMTLTIDKPRSEAKTTPIDTTAKLGQNGTPVPMPSEYLTFRLGPEEYGIDILNVQEIRSHEEPTRIANAPDAIKGVINLRGVIVPIVDLRLTMGCAAANYTDFTVVIVLNVRDRVVGAVVDSVSDVLQLSADQIKAAPDMDSNGDTRHILGIGCLRQANEDRMLILTDIEALMSGPAIGLMGDPMH